MRRVRFAFVFIVFAVLAAPIVRADSKLQQKVDLKFGGALGGVINKFGGATTREGLVTTVAIKGNRKSEMAGDTGSIIDLDEQKVYNLDIKNKTYKVTTFAELRAAFEKARADAQQKTSEMKPEDKQQTEDTTKQYELEADVRETGQKKNIAGYDTREVIVTITAHEKGKKIEESGGLVMTSDLWLGPKVAAVDEAVQFQIKYMKAVYGDSVVADTQQMASTVAMYPTFQPMATKMQAESSKLQGTALLSSTTFDSVKSADAMKEAQQPQPTPTTTSGIGGALAKKLMTGKNPPSQRSTVFTANHEVLQVAASATADDVALPANFKEKK